MNNEKSYGLKQGLNYLKIDDKEYYDMNYNKTYDAVKKELEKELIKVDMDGCYVHINIERDEIDNAAFHIIEQSLVKHIYCDKFPYYKRIEKGDKLFIKKNQLSLIGLKIWKKNSIYKLCFRPRELPEQLNKKYYNMFKGFRAQHLPVCKDYTKIEKNLNHLKEVIANDNEKVYKYILQWIKKILNGERTNVMIFLKGKQGIGKNIFINMLAYGIIGKEYSIASSMPEKQFFGQFNSGLQNRVLAIINEGQNGMRDCIDRIKDFITEDTISIERKGKDPIILDNTTNFIGDTNNFNILNISLDDRRFVWTECSSKSIGNKDYFDSLANECQNDESLSAFYHYILEEVNDNPDLQKTRPITDIYLKLQKMNLPNFFKFLIALYDNKIKYRKNKMDNHLKQKNHPVFTKIITLIVQDINMNHIHLTNLNQNY